MESRRNVAQEDTPEGLQWSHGILAMESCEFPYQNIQHDTASMEPWHFSHGEPQCRLLGLPPHMLQWSHGILAMESPRRTACAPMTAGASMEPWHFSHGEDEIF